MGGKQGGCGSWKPGHDSASRGQQWTTQPTPERGYTARTGIPILLTDKKVTSRLSTISMEWSYRSVRGTEARIEWAEEFMRSKETEEVQFSRIKQETLTQTYNNLQGRRSSFQPHWPPYSLNSPVSTSWLSYLLFLQLGTLFLLINKWLFPNSSGLRSEIIFSVKSPLTMYLMLTLTSHISLLFGTSHYLTGHILFLCLLFTSFPHPS